MQIQSLFYISSYPKASNKVIYTSSRSLVVTSRTLLTLYYYLIFSLS